MVEFTTEFASNRQARCPCVLVLDNSASMQGAKIKALNAGLVAFADDLKRDTLASRKVEVAILDFPPVGHPSFEPAADFRPPTLAASGGSSPLGSALMRALEITEARKAQFKRSGIEYYVPWIFVITDGMPTDDANSWDQAARVSREAVMKRRALVWAVGVDVDKSAFEKLSQISTKPPARLEGLMFREMFLWLTSSLRAVSNSQSHTGGNPGAEVSLEQPGPWCTTGV